MRSSRNQTLWFPKNSCPPKRGKAKSSLLLLPLTCLAAFGLQAGTVVAPSSCDQSDGNDAVVSSPWPSFRGQRLYSASSFANMAPGVLVSMAFRPDRSVTAPRTVAMRNWEVRLSTTRRGTGATSPLSTRFDDNLGPDTTLVFSGDVSWTTQGDGPSSGPRAFDYIVPFQRPFLYNPANESLSSPLAIQVPNATSVGGGAGGGRPVAIGNRSVTALKLFWISIVGPCT